VITISAFVPESGIMLTRASPRLFATPAIVRLCWLLLKSSAASTRSCSSGERRRSTGSASTGSGISRRVSKSEPRFQERRRLRGAAGTTGVRGVPSFSQPYSFAWSRQSAQTSTQWSSPPGE